MKKSKKTFLIFLIGFVIGIIGFTSSLLMYLKPNEVVVDNKNKDLFGDEDSYIASDIIFSSIDDSVYLENAIPTLDKFGVESKGFSFRIKNTSNVSLEYQLKLVDDNSTIKNSLIRYELIRNGKSLGIDTLPEDGIIDKFTINNNEEINYVLKLWLDYNSDAKTGRFNKKIAVQELKETTLSVINKPILTDGMIPVYYDNSTNSWHKAASDNNDGKWYSYEDKKWANVVTVNAEKREYYMNSELDTRIATKDINSMWVWIPRFTYDNGNINLVNKSEKAYLAFTFNNQELDGFWFSKFESGMQEDSECISFSLTNKCNDSSNLLYFVPNYPFATKMTMANIFYAIRKMELKNNIYGFKGTGTKLNSDGTIKNDNNDFDIHMIKNSEWQAVVLLSSSKYGLNDNTKYANNNSSYTGKTYYDNQEFNYNVIGKGDRGSTTGNVTGVYDMFGGKREYVMLDNDKLSIFNKKSNSGFTTKVKEYYYDNSLLDSDTTISLSNKYSKNNLVNNEPFTRGGYKNIGDMYNIYGTTDYINKISVETNSRASLVIIKGE